MGEVDFPNLKLPTNIAPWDTLHRTVSKKNIHVMNFFPLYSFDSNTVRHQHVPIPMKTLLCRKSCCSVTYCPLVPAYATTIHKFQGFEAGFDENDQFQHLIIDPGDIKSEQQQPGLLYIATSRVKTIGDMTHDLPHPQEQCSLLDWFWNEHKQSVEWYHQETTKHTRTREG